MKWMFMLLLLAGLASACSEDPGTGERVEVEDLRLVQDPSGGRYVSGLVRNLGDKPFHAQVQVSLFDATNRRVALLNVPVQNVRPGDGKSFRQVVDSDVDVRGARVRQVLLF